MQNHRRFVLWMTVALVAWCGEATFADLNQDGFADLYLANMQGDDRFYENAGGTRLSDWAATWAATGFQSAVPRKPKRAAAISRRMEAFMRAPVWALEVPHELQESNGTPGKAPTRDGTRPWSG